MAANPLLARDLQPVPPADWQGLRTHAGENVVGVWRSRRYEVVATDVPACPGVVRLGVVYKTSAGSWRGGMTWEELMAVKAAVGYGDEWAVEVYPAAAETLADVNMRHLFVLPAAPPYAFRATPQTPADMVDREHFDKLARALGATGRKPAGVH